MYNRTKNQAESDEKANQYQSFYSIIKNIILNFKFYKGQIKEIDGKIDSLQIKVKDVQAQIRRIKVNNKFFLFLYE